MSDKDLEKAREIFENHEKSHHGKVILLCPSAACIGAQGFLEGHASRDPEVADLKAEVRRLQEALQHEVHCVECGESGCPCDDGCTSEEVLKSATPGHSPEGKTL